MTAAGLAMPALGGCAADDTAYDAAVADMIRLLPTDPALHDLVRYATLAANGHNSQPWRFRAGDRAVDILPDFARRTPVVDPDDHHLFASLGCAAENLSLAARARGFSGDVTFDSTEHGHARVDLMPAVRHETDLFAAIPARQSSRAVYDGHAVPADGLQRLMSVATHDGVDVLPIIEDKAVEDLLELVVAGNSRQIDDPAFVAELKHWLRFNADAALAARDGLYSAVSGNPTLPDWLGPLMFDLLFRKGPENDKYAEQIRSSAGLAVFVASSDDPAGWFAAGRACQRFALQATVDGLKLAFINQPVEVPDLRAELRALLGLGERRPNLVVRFGQGPAMPRSLRRRVDDVMV